MKKETGRKIIILGCPGSGKSTLASQLAEKTGLPLVHLDQIWWKEDKSHISRPEFDQKLEEILKAESWIIDGDYSRTYEVRFQNCDTVIFLDYPAEVCLNGVRARRGTPRSDLPWTEAPDEEDAEFLAMIRDFSVQSRPQLLALPEQYPDKTVHIFTDRREADLFLAGL